MIDLYYWPTPNGWKVSIALEEMELPYEMFPVNIGRGEQFDPEFLAISPNNRMPAIVDHEPADGGPALSIFESGAILLYLADKSGRFLPRELRQRVEVTEWLMWQMGGVGPMFGQNHHFRIYAPEPIDYAIERYTGEAQRLYRVLDGRLAEREYVCGDYSIADMAIWPWVVPHRNQGVDLDAFANVRRWYDAMKQRPGVQRGFDLGKDIRKAMARGPDPKAREILFGRSPGA